MMAGLFLAIFRFQRVKEVQLVIIKDNVLTFRSSSDDIITQRFKLRCDRVNEQFRPCCSRVGRDLSV